MPDEPIKLNVVDERQVDELAEAITNFIGDDTPNELVLAALADVVAICCQIVNENNPDTVLNDFYERAHTQCHTVWVKRATPKPDSVTPFVRPEKDPEEE